MLEFLKKEDLYDLDDCLQFCSEYNLQRASAYLLERKGDIEGALVMYTQVRVGCVLSLSSIPLVSDLILSALECRI